MSDDAIAVRPFYLDRWQAARAAGDETAAAPYAWLLAANKAPLMMAGDGGGAVYLWDAAGFNSSKRLPHYTLPSVLFEVVPGGAGRTVRVFATLAAAVDAGAAGQG
jgi:hypothetical protein